MQNDLGAILFVLFITVIYFCASAYGIAKCRMNNLTKESGKPIIRHCRNCKYWRQGMQLFDCQVRYKDVLCERIRALFCRYYKAKEGGKNAD